LNNKLAEARADVLAAEYSVLLKLTDQLRPFLDDIQSALNIIVGIDVVCVSEPPFFPRFSFMDFPSVDSSVFKLLMKYLPSGEGLILWG
jgi:hypothetical protein